MDIRNAILKAADWIQNHPKQWDFHNFKVPDCGSPGCALGWIGAFMGIKKGTLLHDAGGPIKSLGLTSDITFYDRMAELHGNRAWKTPELCARTLRAYADAYHPAPAIRVPDWSALSTPDAAVLASVS